MLPFLQRLTFTTFAVVALTGPATCQDEIAQDLHQSRERFDAAEADFDTGIGAWLDSLESKARSRGDRESVVKIKDARESFKKTGESPSGAPRQLLRKRTAARARLQREYSLIIGKLTRLGFDARAEAAEKELQELLSAAYRVTWIPIFTDGQFGDNVSKGAFSVKDGMLVSDGDRDKLLFCMTPLKNFRVRLTYQITPEGEAALIFRCPNARKEREVGYSVGLNSEKGWIYNANKAFRFIHMSARAKKLSDFNTHPARGVTDHAKPHTVEVIGSGNRFRIILDGRVLFDFSDDAHAEGVLGIQSRQGTITIQSFQYAALP